MKDEAAGGGGVASAPPTLWRRLTPELDPPRGAVRPRPLRAHPTSRPGSAGSAAGRGAPHQPRRDGARGREAVRERLRRGKRRAGGEEAAGLRCAARLLSPAPLRCGPGHGSQRRPAAEGTPLSFPAAAPLHRAAARIPARLYPPAPVSGRPAPRGPRPGWGSWVPARYARLPAPRPSAAPGRAKMAARLPPREPSSDVNRKGPRRGGRRRRVAARGRAGAGCGAGSGGRAAPFFVWRSLPPPRPPAWVGGTPTVPGAPPGAVGAWLSCPSPPGAAPARHEGGSRVCRVSPTRALGGDETPAAAGPGVRGETV
ncbi:uncharacterized protein ACIB01_008458 [Guaruba guarouba]